MEKIMSKKKGFKAFRRGEVAYDAETFAQGNGPVGIPLG